MTTTHPDSAADSAPDRSQAAVARLAMITLDALETEPLARFWSEVLGWPIVHLEKEYAMLAGPSHALGIGAVPDHRPPSWPDSGALRGARRGAGGGAAEVDVDRAARSGGAPVLPDRRRELGLSGQRTSLASWA